MRRIFLLLVPLLAACGGSDDEAPGSAAPGADSASVRDAAAAPSAAPTPAEAAPAAPGDEAAGPERGTFIVTNQGRTLLTERFTRSAARVESELAVAGGGRATQTVTLTPQGGVSRYEYRQVAGGDSGRAAGRMVITLRGDSAFFDSRLGERTERGGVATRPNAIPMFVDESGVLIEQILRRARAIGGREAEVPVLTRAGRTVLVKVTFTGADSARIQAQDADIRMATDARGRLLGARTAAGATLRRARDTGS